MLEARPYPFKGRQYKAVATAKSGLDGRFALEHAFDRNQRRARHRARVPRRPQLRPAGLRLPRSALNFGLVRRNVIRLVQTYRTPKDIRLTAPTRFYVGKQGKKRIPLVAKVETQAGPRQGHEGQEGQIEGPLPRHRGRAHPARLEGRSFRYASCFPYNAGMGNPKLGCPKKRYKLLDLAAARRGRPAPTCSVGAICQPSPCAEPPQLEHDAGSCAATMTSQP